MDSTIPEISAETLDQIRSRVECLSETEEGWNKSLALFSVMLDDLEDLGQIGMPARLSEHEKSQFSLLGYESDKAASEKRLSLIIGFFPEEDDDDLPHTDSESIEEYCRGAVSWLEGLARNGLGESYASELKDLVSDLSGLLETENSAKLDLCVLVGGLKVDEDPIEVSLQGLQVSTEIWDFSRWAALLESGKAHESSWIQLNDYEAGQEIACIPVSAPGARPVCYMASFSGDLIHALYEEHRDQLLELNVRKYLQSSVKVNKGIRKTIENDPELFLSYNNGLTVVADEVRVEELETGGAVISAIRGMQIVNGGQTTASLHEAKESGGCDLGNVIVPAKIIVVSSEEPADLVVNISRFSNTQNKVSESDLSSNNRFHQELEKHAVQLAESSDEECWYYERNRGEYANKLRLSSDGSFAKTFPKKNLLTKLDLARHFNAWTEQPHIASLGPQKGYAQFMKRVESRKITPSLEFFQQSVGRAILYKTIVAFATEAEVKTYKMNVVDYTMARLAYLTAGRIDLDAIARTGEISKALELTIRMWVPAIHEEIIVSADGRNVGEWAKKPGCWSRVQVMKLPIDPGLESELGEGLELPTVGQFKVGKNGKAKELTAEMRENQARVQKYDSDEWNAIIKWGRDRSVLSDFQLKIAGTILGYAAGNWNQVPSPNQTKHLIEVLNLWDKFKQENEGWEE